MKKTSFLVQAVPTTIDLSALMAKRNKVGIKTLNCPVLAATTLCCLSTAAFAAPLSFNAQWSYWSPSSELNNTKGSDSSGYIASTSFEHPVPILPNIRLGLTEANSSEFIETQTDITLYYNVYHSDALKVSLGGGAMQWDLDEGYYEFNDLAILGYSRIEANLPYKGFGTFGELSYALGEKFDKLDWNLGVNYTYSTKLVDVGLQLGYRYQSTTSELLRPVPRDYNSNGLFLGASFSL